MLIVYAFPICFMCRIDKVTGRTVMDPYTPIAFK